MTWLFLIRLFLLDLSAPPLFSLITTSGRFSFDSQILQFFSWDENNKPDRSMTTLFVFSSLTVVTMVWKAMGILHRLYLSSTMVSVWAWQLLTSLHIPWGVCFSTGIWNLYLIMPKYLKHFKSSCFKVGAPKSV